MTAEAKPAGGRRSDPLGRIPDLASHRVIAAKLGITPAAIRARVRKGTWPEPFSVIGSYWYWRASDVECLILTGSWPAGVKFRGGE